MPSLITCPGCTHKLMLPDESVGQRVQCPRCQVAFAASSAPIPAMEMDPAPAAESANVPTAQPAPALETGYAPVERAASRPASLDDGEPSRAIYCIACGTKFAEEEGACPRCGHVIAGPLDGELGSLRRPRGRLIQPVGGVMPIVGAVLIWLGAALVIAAFIADEELRRAPPGQRFWVPMIVGVAGVITVLTAVGFIITWLYQAWRAVLYGDEEYTAGLMVGLLFVPFFNFFWLFRAVPGLSLAIQRELKYVAPARSNAAGWVPGLAACILFLVPGPLWVVALCMFLAWMFLANNAVQRLIRIHDQMREDAARYADKSKESV